MHDHCYLILAQSGRFLAQSLRQYGYPVWVADCFGDSDTLAACSHWLPLPTPCTPKAVQSVLEQLPTDKNFHLLCGSGVEYFYPALTKLADNLTVLGNTAETLRRIKTPELFFKQLHQLEIPHPETQFNHPQRDNTWLVKSAHGMGGTHIQYLSSAPSQADSYFQRHYAGLSGSGLFLANGKNAVVLSLNKHFYTATASQPFRLEAIDNSLTLSHDQQQILTTAISKLTQQNTLLGLNSIDFIIDQHERLLVTEINPRPSASAELLPDTVNASWLHLQACRGILPQTNLNAGHKACLIYHFAQKTVTISENTHWPEHTYDIPNTGTKINKQQVACTSVIKNCHYDSSLHQSLTSDIVDQLELLEN